MPDEQSFEAGDVVALKSGGPNMTVEKTGNLASSGKPAVWCSWFDGKKKVTDAFTPATLKKV